jgi:hypothetical protein
MAMMSTVDPKFTTYVAPVAKITLSMRMLSFAATTAATASFTKRENENFCSMKLAENN